MDINILDYTNKHGESKIYLTNATEEDMKQFSIPVYDIKKENSAELLTSRGDSSRKSDYVLYSGLDTSIIFSFKRRSDDKVSVKGYILQVGDVKDAKVLYYDELTESLYIEKLGKDLYIDYLDTTESSVLYYKIKTALKWLKEDKIGENIYQNENKGRRMGKNRNKKEERLLDDYYLAEFGEKFNKNRRGRYLEDRGKYFTINGEYLTKINGSLYTKLELSSIKEVLEGDIIKLKSGKNIKRNGTGTIHTVMMNEYYIVKKIRKNTPVSNSRTGKIEFYQQTAGLILLPYNIKTNIVGYTNYVVKDLEKGDIRYFNYHNKIK